MRKYIVSIADMYSARRLVQAIGVDTITEAGQAPKVRDLIRIFPAAGKEQAHAFNRPRGAIQLLLGMESHSLYSRDGLKAGKPQT